MLTAMDVQALAARCAPVVAPSTLLAVAKAESGFNPLAIGVNSPRPGRLSPTDKAEAVAKARQLVAAGASVDLGLAQINARNIGWLGLTIEAAFDPCLNLKAAARVLQAGYALGDPARVGEQQALRVAFSYYNTGRADRGFANGYVAKVTAAGRTVSALQPDGAKAAVVLHATPPAPTWDVFAQAPAPAAGFVFIPVNSGDGQ